MDSLVEAGRLPEQKTAGSMLFPEQKTAGPMLLPEQKTAGSMLFPEQKTADPMLFPGLRITLNIYQKEDHNGDHYARISYNRTDS